MTKGDLLKLLEPYALEEQVVFVTFDKAEINVHEEVDVTVHHEVSVAKDHGTTCRKEDGSVSMPVAIYMVDAGTPGTARIMGS